MLDIGFLELLVTATVALLVLGPDRLPGAIRTAALWLGRAKRSFNKAKAEIEQQLNTDEIRRQLHNESILEDIEKARRSADKLIKDTQQEIDAEIKTTQKSIDQAVDSVKNIPVVTNSAQEGLPTSSAAAEASTHPIAAGDHVASTDAPLTDGELTDSDRPHPEPVEQNAEPDTESVTNLKAETDNTLPEEAETPPPAPVEDFYNSPPQGRIRMEGGKFYAVENEEEQAKGKDSTAAADSEQSGPKPARHRADEH